MNMQGSAENVAWIRNPVVLHLLGDSALVADMTPAAKAALEAWKINLERVLRGMGGTAK